MGDRQLNQYDYHAVRVDSRRLLSQGYTWEYQLPSYILIGGTIRVVSFTTEAAPVFVGKSSGLSIGPTLLVVESYVGGTVGGGGAVIGLPQNHSDPKPSPLVLMRDGGTISEAGTKISENVIYGADNASLDADTRLILRGDSSYYITIENRGIPALSFAGTWDCLIQNQAPLPGEVAQSVQGGTLTFSVQDDALADRRAELESVSPGWVITTGDGDSWNVLTVTPGASDVAYTVSPAALAVPGLLAFTFQEPAAPSDVYMELALEFAALPKADLF